LGTPPSKRYLTRTFRDIQEQRKLLTTHSETRN